MFALYSPYWNCWRSYIVIDLLFSGDFSTLILYRETLIWQC